MAAYNKFNSFVEDIAEGVHNLQTGVRQPKRCGGGESWRNVEEGNREMRKYGRN
jgi:hypothetical protein